ncbi:transposase [Microbacterium lacticum]|uniref:transposase n=1 Tax=Microbacterium lacticum TaxID=33885 RepID=UPI003A8C3E9A
MNRRFTAPAPRRLWVCDVTYVATWSGFAYVAFVTDVYSRRIVGWNVAATLPSEILPMQALDMAAWNAGGRLDGLIHHADHGSNGGFNWLSQHLDREVFSDGDGGLEQVDQRSARECASAVACGSGVASADALARAA